jgi:hypothetical protein
MRLRAGSTLFVGLILAACGGENGGSGPTGPSQFPSVAGIWFINQAVINTTCPGVIPQEPFAGGITQSGSQIQMTVDIVGFIGNVQYVGTIQTNGDFNMSQTTTFPDIGARSQSTVSGRFSGASLSATEDETLTDLATGLGCSIQWRWTGNL